MPVNDCSKMTTESAGMQGKDSVLAFQKAWVPPHPQRTAREGQISLLLQSMGASTPTTYGAQEFCSESMGVHTPTMY